MKTLTAKQPEVHVICCPSLSRHVMWTLSSLVTPEDREDRVSRSQCPSTTETGLAVVLVQHTCPLKSLLIFKELLLGIKCLQMPF